MHGRMASSIALVALSVTVDANAQELPVYLLPPLGSEVRVEYSVLGAPTRIEGILVDGTARGIALETAPGVRRDFSAELLVGLQVQGRSPRRGLAAGLVMGGVGTAAAAGLLSLLTFDEGSCLLSPCGPGPTVRASALAGAVFGAFLGAGIGAGVASTGWERVW